MTKSIHINILFVYKVIFVNNYDSACKASDNKLFKFFYVPNPSYEYIN